MEAGLDMENWGISEFFGIVFFLPLLSYLVFALFDGLSIFRDVFSNPGRR
jgi:hypothetical protein